MKGIGEILKKEREAQKITLEQVEETTKIRRKYLEAIEPRGFSRGVAGFSNYDGEFRMPLVLAQASPIFHSSCEGKLGIALE